VSTSPRSPQKSRGRAGTTTVRAPLLLEHKSRTGRDGADLVFGSERDHPFTPTHIRKKALKAWEDWKAAEAEKAKEEDRNPELLEPVGLRELRHSYVSMMHAVGLSLETIGDFVGHSSTYMTDGHRHLLEGQEAEAGKRLEAYLAAPVSSRAATSAQSISFR
jgi:integrase